MSTPPRFVPTLTDVVQPPPAPEAPPPSEPVAWQAEPAIRAEVVSASLAPAMLAELEERLIVGVMQRIDVVLERKLREAIGQVISEHSEGLAERLREEIGEVVRHAVNDAVEQESAAIAIRS